MKACHVCGGEGFVEWSEDCYSYAHSAHFTIDHGATCTACNGTGLSNEEPESFATIEPGWLVGTPEGACDAPTEEEVARLLAHFAGGKA